jgi:hypothetical protein
MRQRQDGPKPENRTRDPAVKIVLDGGSHINGRYQPRPKAVRCMPWFGAVAYSVRLASPLAASTRVVRCSGGDTSYPVTRLATPLSPP